MKRFPLFLVLAASLLILPSPAQAAPDLPDFSVLQTFRAKIHVAGGVTITTTKDTTGDCVPGQAWTMTESVDLEINDKVSGSLFRNKIASRFATGNVEQTSRIRNYRETNNCPPVAKVKLEQPECDSFGGRSLSNLVPDGRGNGGISIAMTRRGGGSQDLSCIGGFVRSKPKGTAVTALPHVFTPINLPLDVKVKAFKKLDRGDKIIRVIRIGGQCDRATVTTGGPGITRAAADETCRVDGLFNVIVKRLGD
ncbi:MAG TPA: hypothetical protein VMF31_05620 [Solirubrobacterales bacterium]|nr:hypothetical protein [Solirubrobacterales bacterium]